MMMQRIALALAIVSAGAATCRAEDLYLSVGPGGERMFSKDGHAWDQHASWGKPGHDTNDLSAAAFFKGAAYAGGGYFSARITATRDGKTWSEGVLTHGSPIFGLEVVDGALYAVTLRGQVYKSTDGETFDLLGQATMPTDRHWIRFTASGNGTIVGSGDYGPVLTFDAKSGKIAVTQLAGQQDKLPAIKSVAFGNGTFVVCGQNGVLAASTDGVTWNNNEVHPERGDFTSVFWTGQEFLANSKKKGEPRAAYVSKDGLTWTKRDVGFPGNVESILSAHGQFYGWSWPPSTVQHSRDGSKWEPMPNPREFWVYRVAFGSLDGAGSAPKLPNPPPPAKK